MGDTGFCTEGYRPSTYALVAINSCASDFNCSAWNALFYPRQILPDRRQTKPPTVSAVHRIGIPPQFLKKTRLTQIMRSFK